MATMAALFASEAFLPALAAGVGVVAATVLPLAARSDSHRSRPCKHIVPSQVFITSGAGEGPTRFNPVCEASCSPPSAVKARPQGQSVSDYCQAEINENSVGQDEKDHCMLPCCRVVGPTERFLWAMFLGAESEIEEVASGNAEVPS